MGARDDFWVFGYASLMWRPGFDYLEVRPATVYGHHRALCIYSWLYRGTKACPGLVFGLDRGGSCLGRAFRVAADRTEAVRDYLFAREMEYAVYRQVTLAARLADGRRVAAFSHVVDRACEQYAGKLSEARLVELVRQGHGTMGSCRDYLVNTVAHLDELGIRDGPLHKLLARVEATAR